MILNVVGEALSRGWENFLARPDGPMNFRFIFQPLMVSIFAILAGIKDARTGQPAYLWAAFTNAENRSELIHSGWKDMRMPFLMAVILDSIYQVIIHRGIFLLELLFSVTILAIVPYLILRGPVCRIAKMFISTKKTTP